MTRDKHRKRGAIAGLLFGLLVLPLVSPTWAGTLTDSADRKVAIPDDVRAIVPAGPPAQVLLHALAPERLVGLVEPFKPEHAIYVAAKIAALPQIPMLSRTAAPGDVASVAALKPGLCVDYGNVSARYVAATEKIAQELKAPAAILSGDLASTESTVASLGTAIGAGARTGVVASAVRDAMSRVKSLADLPDDRRPAVYVARGADGLMAERAGSAFDEPVRLAGGRNVVVSSGGSFARLSVADVVALKPSIVIFAESEATSSPLVAALPKDTKIVYDAGEPYKVLTGPPSINRVIGMVALAALLHPDTVKLEPDAATRLATTLFPIPPGLAEPSPLQVRR